MRVWRRLGPLLVVLLIFTPLLAVMPSPMPPEVQEAKGAEAQELTPTQIIVPTEAPEPAGGTSRPAPSIAQEGTDQTVDQLVQILIQILQEILGVSTPDGDSAVNRTEAVEVVDDDGFTLALDGLTVSGASDVAPNGTTVRARLVEQDLPDDVGGFADPVGTGVEITLGEGIQPASPVTITFAPDEVAAWGAVPDLTIDLVPVVFASRPDGSGVELADAQMLPDGSVVVTTDHLSWFQPVLASISGFTNWFSDQVLTFLDIRSQKPICVDQLEDDDGWHFSTVADQPVWTCIATTSGEVEVTFTNNSPTVWLVKSDQAVPLPITTLSINGTISLALANRGIDQGTAPLIPPDGAVTFQVNDLHGPIVFDASLNPPLTVVAAVMSVLFGILPADITEKLGRAQCFLDIVSSSVDTSVREFDEPAIGDLAATIINCTLSLIKDIRAGFIGGLLAVPGAITALADGFVRELSGGNEFSITLSRTDEVAEEPVGGASASSWPTDRDDGPGRLYIWLGANFYNLPSWVACDDARTYCLLGYPGGSHAVVSMRGLDIIGEVPDSANDPRQALLALGLSGASVSQILGSPGGDPGDDVANDELTTPGGDQEANNQPATPDAAEEENAQIIVPVGDEEAQDEHATPDGDQGVSDQPATPDSDQESNDQVIVPIGSEDGAQQSNSQANEGATTSTDADASTTGSANVRIVTVAAQGLSITDVCYVLIDFGDEACDDDEDGAVTFTDVPVGIYTVRQTADLSPTLGPDAWVPDTTITVTGQSHDDWETFDNLLTYRSKVPGAVHVEIQTLENGDIATDVCYVLVELGKESCDEGGYGLVWLRDVPYGTYTVHQTADLGPGRKVDDFTIEVSTAGLKNGWVTFRTTVSSDPASTEPQDNDQVIVPIGPQDGDQVSAGPEQGAGDDAVIHSDAGALASGSSGLIDVALITRDPVDGHLLPGACYVLAGYGSEGCDENGDGQVPFDSVPSGAYTVRQTQAPTGYPLINNYDINVWPLGDLPDGSVMEVPLGFVVRQAPQQNAPGTLNVSVIMIDAATGEKVSTGVCVEMVGGSTVRCDDDLPDGQIDFLDVPEGGPYELRFSNVPAGWQVGTDGQPYNVSVNPQLYTSPNLFAFILLVGPDSESASTRSGPDASLTSDSPESQIDYFIVRCDPIEACLNATLIVSTEDGDFISSGTCPDTIEITPWWCLASNVPRGIDVMLTLDDIASGYMAEQNPVFWDTTLEPEPYGAKPTFTFVPTDGSTSNGTTGSVIAPASGNSSEATLLMTFRGCPEGFDPNTDDFHAACTIPLDAPDYSYITWDLNFPNDPGGMHITDLERQNDGAYIFQASPETMDLTLSDLGPVVRDAYQVMGVDDGLGSDYLVYLADGETREVFIFSYYD